MSISGEADADTLIFFDLQWLHANVFPVLPALSFLFFTLLREDEMLASLLGLTDASSRHGSMVAIVNVAQHSRYSLS
jgi:hypothetical protein